MKPAIKHNEIRPGLLTVIDRWLDSEVSAEYRMQPLAQDWARTCKVIEELGEAIAELILLTGQNPRKEQTMGTDKFLAEMGDVVITAMLGIMHFTKNEATVMMYVRQAMDKAYGRAKEAGYDDIMIRVEVD